jgi:acetyl esterase/lipase
MLPLRIFSALLVIGVGLFAAESSPQTPAASKPAAGRVPPVPPATVADISYGSHPHQLLDLYAPKTGTGPYPVLLWFGGLWVPGKRPVDPNRFLPAEIAVIAVESRTLNDGIADHVEPPDSYPMNDAARAVQFVRLNAKKWNLDPDRIAVGGGSQGALPALFVGCAADRGQPDSKDPVERMSSKVTCVAAYRSQPSIDPKQMQDWVPGVKWGAPALGCAFEQSLARRDELLPVIQKWSPDHLVTAAAAPIYFENNWDLTRPADVAEADYQVHSPTWALGFQKIAQAAGAKCFVKYPGHPTDSYEDIWDFIRKELKAGK